MVKDKLVIENAKIVYRNFSGKAGRFNAEGQRNFCVLLEDDVAETLARDGWNVRWLEPRDPADKKQAYTQIRVAYGNVPPKIVLVTSRNKTVLDESSVNILDWAEIEAVDLIINPYSWSVGGKTGVKGYVSRMYVTIAEDEFEKKYVDVPDSAMSAEEDGS